MKLSLKKLIPSQEIRDRRHKNETRRIKFIVASIILTVTSLIFLGLDFFATFGLVIFSILMGIILIITPIITIYKIINPSTKYQYISNLLLFIFVVEVILVYTGHGNLIIGTLFAVIGLLIGSLSYKRIVKNLKIKTREQEDQL